MTLLDPKKYGLYSLLHAYMYAFIQNMSNICVCQELLGTDGTEGNTFHPQNRVKFNVEKFKIGMELRAKAEKGTCFLFLCFLFLWIDGIKFSIYQSTPWRLRQLAKTNIFSAAKLSLWTERSDVGHFIWAVEYCKS